MNTQAISATSRTQETLARSALYELLSAAFLYPEKGRAAALAGGVPRLQAACLALGWQPLAEALAELERRLAGLDDLDLERQYIAVFGHTISGDCPPYETEYDNAHVFQKSQTLAGLGAYCQAFGVQVNPKIKERPDHISVELGLMNLLALKEAYAELQHHGDDKALICRQAQEAFLSQHLAHWIRAFIRRLGQRSGNGSLYASVGQVLSLHMEQELARFRLVDTPTKDMPLDPEETPETREDDLGCEVCPAEGNLTQGTEDA